MDLGQRSQNSKLRYCPKQVHRTQLHHRKVTKATINLAQPETKKTSKTNLTIIQITKHRDPRPPELQTLAVTWGHGTQAVLIRASGGWVTDVHTSLEAKGPHSRARVWCTGR